MRWSAEFKVGLMTIIGLSVLAISILFIKNFRLGGGEIDTVSFHFLGDLKSDSPVEYAGGIQVGFVKDIRLGPQGEALADLLITQKDFHLHQDSQVAIYTAGLLGSKYVQIAADLGTGPLLQPGEVLAGKDSNNLDETFSELGDVFEAFESMMGDPKAKANFLRAFENLDSATDNLLELSSDSRAKINTILNNLVRSSGNADTIIASVKSLSQTLDDLNQALDKKDVNASIKNLNATLVTVNQLAQDIHDGKGAVGVLLQDPQVAQDLRDLVTELKAHPWKLLWKQ